MSVLKHPNYVVKIFDTEIKSSKSEKSVTYKSTEASLSNKLRLSHNNTVICCGFVIRTNKASNSANTDLWWDFAIKLIYTTSESPN